MFFGDNNTRLLSFKMIGFSKGGAYRSLNIIILLFLKACSHYAFPLDDLNVIFQ